VENGITDFLVLEAESEIGGRMKNEHFAGKTVEVGANWVQGTEGSWLWELNQRYSIRSRNSDFDDSRVFDDDGRVPWSKLDYAGYGKASRFADRFANNLNENDRDDINLRATFGLRGWLANNKFDDIVEVNDHNYEYAIPSRAVSTRGGRPLDVYEDFKDEDAFVSDQRGWNHILISLAKDQGFFDKIQLDTLITRIEDCKDKGVTVTTNKGAEYSADYVIVTFSIGVLAFGSVEFQPPLPPWKRKAILPQEMALYTKIFLEFDDQYWPDTEFFEYAADLKGWYPIWQNMNHPKYFGPGPPYILMVTVFDDIGRMVERQSKRETMEQAVEVLRTIFPRRNIRDPVDVHVFKWFADTLYKGSYSSDTKVGWSNAYQQALSLPLGSIFFAGEAFAFKYRGYVHGALFSGNETGEAVVHCVKEPSCCVDQYRHYEKRPVFGCTNKSAPNFNPAAVIDDRSCQNPRSGTNTSKELLSSKTGWPGKCEGLKLIFGGGLPGEVDSCRGGCAVDPDCGVWQVDALGVCRHGVGFQCITTWGSAAGLWNIKQVKAAGMYQHGRVEVLVPDLSGKEVRGLGQAEKPSSPLDSAIANCRGICYSDMACTVWQYGRHSGCFVEHTKLGFRAKWPPVKDTDRARDVIAGEKIAHHYTKNTMELKASLPEHLAQKVAGAPAALRGVAVPGLLLACVAAGAGLLARTRRRLFGGGEQVSKPIASVDPLTDEAAVVVE